MATPRAIALGVNTLKIAYPNYNPDIDGTCTLWLKLLADVDDDTLNAAIISCLTQSRAFAPSIGEIRGAAMELHVKSAGIPSAYEAYEEVLKMPRNMIARKLIREGGENIILETPVKYSHPIVEAVARQLGWPQTFPTDNPGVDRGQFRQAYELEMSAVISDSSRLPVLQSYIEQRRPQLSGNAPTIMASVAKMLGEK